MLRRAGLKFFKKYEGIGRRYRGARRICPFTPTASPTCFPPQLASTFASSPPSRASATSMSSTSLTFSVKKALVLSNWEISKELFTTNDLVVSSRPKLVVVELMSYNKAFVGLAPYEPYWRELRKIVTYEFLSNRRIEKLCQIRLSEVQTSIKELCNLCYTRSVNNKNKKKNESSYCAASLVDMQEWFAHLTFNIIVRMVVGKRYFGMVHVEGKEKVERFMKNLRGFMNLMETFTMADRSPYLRWLDLGAYEKAMKAMTEEMDKLLSEWLEEHREKKGFGGKVKGDEDFMDVMISAFNGAQIDGFDADTISKATTLIRNTIYLNTCDD